VNFSTAVILSEAKDLGWAEILRFAQDDSSLRMTAGGRGEPTGVDGRTGTPVLLGLSERLWG